MTPTQKKRVSIEEIIVDLGWVVDRWGNYKKIVGDSIYRLKFQKTSLRYEVKVTGSGGWLNLRSDYYKNIEVGERGIYIKGILTR